MAPTDPSPDRLGRWWRGVVVRLARWWRGVVVRLGRWWLGVVRLARWRDRLARSGDELGRGHGLDLSVRNARTRHLGRRPLGLHLVEGERAAVRRRRQLGA